MVKSLVEVVAIIIYPDPIPSDNPQGISPLFACHDAMTSFTTDVDTTSQGWAWAKLESHLQRKPSG